MFGTDLNPAGGVCECECVCGAASVVRATMDAGGVLALLLTGRRFVICGVFGCCLLRRAVAATLMADGSDGAFGPVGWGDLLLRDSENMITVQEDRAMFVCSTRIQNGEPSARTSCRARVRPDSACRYSISTDRPRSCNDWLSDLG